MGLFNRRMTVEVRDDSGGSLFAISGAADDPCRSLIVNSAAEILEKHGRWEEATNFRASNNWGPLLHDDIAATAPQPFDVKEHGDVVVDKSSAVTPTITPVAKAEPK